MVRKAVQYKLGGRGLRAICEMILTDAMFDLPSEQHDGTFRLTLEYAEQMIEHSKLEQIKKAA
jgi:ATP-dependent Clp protease ATP-binding subunit ClpX